MRLAGQAAQSLGRLLAGWADVSAHSTLEVNGLCHDSRVLRPGDLFFALSGRQSHGMKHASQAVASGARAILYDPAHGGAELAAEFDLTEVPLIPLERLEYVMGPIADRFYGEPSDLMRVIGVTGTNGKTSCTHFIAQTMEPDLPSAVIGTLGWGVPGALQSTTHTTPDAIEVHRLLSRLLAQGIRRVAMEASSHGLDQGRLNGIRFRGGLFTNFSRDHLDYHGSMEAYLEAKLRLLAWPGLEYMAFNLDDDSSEIIMQRSPRTLRKVGFTLQERIKPSSDMEVLRASKVSHMAEGIAFDVCFGEKIETVVAPVYGDFNAENLLGVLAVLLAEGMDLGAAAQRLALVRSVPGRMERFGGGDGPTAVVDYAHTPDALSKVLASLRRHCKGSLWVVVGCGGDRDRGKRPQMGAIAEKMADHVVLTDDNPRSEDGPSIIRDILEGCERPDIKVIHDRRSAIKYALGQLGRNDVALIAGKGHEDTQEIGGVKHPFSDRDIVRQTLAHSTEVYASCA